MCYNLDRDVAPPVAVYVERPEDASQGDVFAAVPFAGAGTSEGFRMDGMITAHHCVCDKFFRLSGDEAERFVVAVAPVHSFDELTGGRRPAAREGHMPRYFYLPAEASRPELVVDLYLEQPVRMVDLLVCDRLSSLSAEWLGRLWQQFLRLRLREDYMAFITELLEHSDAP